MIGMNQIKKRLIHGILIGLGVGIVGIIITLLVTNNIVKGYKEGTNEDFLRENTVMVTTFNRDVIQGERITEDMLKETRIHKTLLPLNSCSSPVGLIAKYNIPSNATITNDMFGDYIVGSDVRIQEVNAVVMPSDLTEGEYIDIRLMMPDGIEYIVLAQKQVRDIVANTIKIDLSDEEILILNGAIVDSYLTEGSKLYGIKYSDPSTQIKVSEEAMKEAKNKLTEELAKELVEKGAISKNDNAVEEMVENIATNAANNNEGVSLEAATGENVINEEKYILSTSELKADDLVELLSEYAVKYRNYVESFDKIETTYQPNVTIIQYMKTNSEILNIAKESLDEDIRRGMELSLQNFKNDSGDEYENVVSGIKTSVSEQKSLRSQALSNQQVVEPVQ